jgi:hypothetical protein
MKKHNVKKGRPMPRWTRTQLATLREFYRNSPNEDVALVTGRSVKSVASMAHRLGLKKSAGRLEQMGRENVAVRWGGCA